MRLGFLVPEFPSQTHAFFWRELSALRDAGHEVQLLSTRRPSDDACPHDFAERARAQTHYVYPPQLTGAASGFSDALVPVIWMGVDVARLAPKATHARVAGSLHIVTVARLNRMKGHVHALRALAQARAQGADVRYSIAGQGEYLAELKAEIARLSLGAHVELLGSLSETQVLCLLARADAFVLPSVGLGEAAPVSVMEAMACGLPVLCSKIGGTPDMITHAVNGYLLEQGDEAALCEHMLLLTRDPALATRIGTAARETALRDFDYRRNADKLLAQIEHAVHLKRSIDKAAAHAGSGEEMAKESPGPRARRGPKR